MRRLQRSCKVALAALLVTLTASCSELDKADIETVLDRRNLAINNQDSAAYSSLIYGDYKDQGKSKIDIIAQTIRIFETFEKTRMQSQDRIIRVLDGTAECEQSYVLEAYADGHWRKVIQRERIYLIETDEGWKISGGL